MTWETEKTKALSSLTVDTKVVPRERPKKLQEARHCNGNVMFLEMCLGNAQSRDGCIDEDVNI